MIKTRTLDGITILDLQGPLAAGQEDAALRAAVRMAFERGATTVILNMQSVPSIDAAGVAALAEHHRQRVDQDRFAGAGFTGQHGESGVELEFHAVDDHEITDIQRAQHANWG